MMDFRSVSEPGKNQGGTAPGISVEQAVKNAKEDRKPNAGSMSSREGYQCPPAEKPQRT